MTRKPIQIAAFAGSEDSYETVYVLCNDGTVWWYDFGTGKKWHRMKDVPQDDDPEE